MFALETPIFALNESGSINGFLGGRYTLLALAGPVLSVMSVTPLTVKVVPSKYTPPPSFWEVLPVMVVPLRFKTISPGIGGRAIDGAAVTVGGVAGDMCCPECPWSLDRW